MSHEPGHRRRFQLPPLEIHVEGLALHDDEGGANVGMLFYNPSNYLERYNAPDTLKCQHTFKLTRGNCLYSDMGRIFCSIVEDSVGWHDTIGANSTKQSVADKWGEHSYQDYRNDWYLNGYDSFLVELAKYGMNARDMAANLNLFSKIAIDDNGDMSFVADNSKAGDYIELRFEMDTLVVLNTCPHPLDPATTWQPRPVELAIWRADPVAADDECMNSCPENQRGFANTAIYHCQYD